MHHVGTQPRARRLGFLTIALAAALALLGGSVMAGLHQHHDDGQDHCALCMLAGSHAGLAPPAPEVAPPSPQFEPRSDDPSQPIIESARVLCCTRAPPTV